MRVDVLTIFPEMFASPMSASILGNARDRALLDLHIHDLRDWTHDNHRTTDDSPYGGGPGMVMKPEPIFEALDEVQALDLPGLVGFLTPGGRRLTQSYVQELATAERLVLVCGRYEGFDERVFTRADFQVSIGDYVLTGGELPAMVLVDACVRLVPGVLGHELSATDETFADGLLEYPQYTRPAVYRGLEVPEVLRSGDHARIAAWRRDQSVRRTAAVRPDLLDRAALTEAERDIASSVRRASGQEGS